MNSSLSRLLTLAILSFGFINCISAQKVSKATLHFATNEYRLNAKQQRYLDSFANSLRNIPGAYGFTVSGHTDSVGSNNYNNTLSYKRATEVGNWLERKGFKQSRMKLEAKGFTSPVASNNNEQNKERNRRVEIEFWLELPKAKTIAGVTNASQTQTMDESGGTFTTSSGTRITVPPNAFTDADGKPVTGKVDIQYTEYRDAIDFLLSDIPMHYNDGKEAIPFNSAGMFTINASQGDKPVYLQNGKRLNVGFNYDGTVNNANFYRWDATQNRWTQLQPLTQTLLDPFKDYMLYQQDMFAESVCQQHEDIRQVLFVSTGLRYSDPSDATVNKLFESVRLYEMEEQTRIKQKLYERKAKQMLRKYQVAVDKRFLAKTGFKIYQVKGKRDKSSEMLEGITFKKNISNAMIDSLEMKMYDDYAIHQTDSGFTLVLYRGSFKMQVGGITITKDEGAKNFDAAKSIAQMEKYYASYKETAQRYRDTVISFEQQADFFSSAAQQILPLSWRSVDSLKCFRNMHSNWMGNDKPSLGLSDWLKYYQNNKASFAAIYKSISETPAYAAIEKKVNKFRNLLLLYNDPAARLNLTSADVQLPGNFSLTSLGTYNCDQLQRLQDPVMLYAQYTNKQGKELKPVIALLIDSKLNGILRYDGNYGLSPYRIAFSPKSTSRMVLIDASGESYLVKPEEFESLDLSLNKANSVYTFVAEPIGKANNKDELRTRLSMR